MCLLFYIHVYSAICARLLVPIVFRWSPTFTIFFAPVPLHPLVGGSAVVTNPLHDEFWLPEQIISTVHIKQDDSTPLISSVQQWCTACRFCVSCRFTLSHKLYLSLLWVCWSIPFPLHHHTSANSCRFCHVATLSQSYSASW